MKLCSSIAVAEAHIHAMNIYRVSKAEALDAVGSPLFIGCLTLGQ